MINFTECSNDSIFERMKIDRIVIGMSFYDLMIKLRHQDRSWAIGIK